MDSNRVNIFHITDGDGCVVTVTHDFVFNLFISLNAFFNQHLMDRRQLQGVFHDRAKGFFVSGKTASCSSQCKGRTQDDRIADLVHRCKSLFHAVRDFRGQDRLPQRLAEFFKKESVLSLLNRGTPGTQKLCSAFGQHALFFQLHGQVQTGLPADAGKDGIRTLIADDLGDIFQGQGLHIDLVRNRCIRHDRRRIRVAQNNLVALFLQGKTGLCPCIIKLCRLPDHDRARADDENFMDISSFGHEGLLFVFTGACFPETCQTGRRCPGDRARSRDGTGRRKLCPGHIPRLQSFRPAG